MYVYLNNKDNRNNFHPYYYDIEICFFGSILKVIFFYLLHFLSQSYNIILHYFLGYINGTRVLMGSYEQFLKTTCFTNMSFLGAIEDGNPDVLQTEVSRYQYFYFYICIYLIRLFFFFTMKGISDFRICVKIDYVVWFFWYGELLLKFCNKLFTGFW